MLDGLEKFNIANLNTGDVIKLYSTDKSQTIANGGIIKMDDQKITLIELVDDTHAKVTVKDSLLKDIGATSLLDFDGMNALYKLIAEIKAQMS
jgi:predicted transcriptional regulator